MFKAIKKDLESIADPERAILLSRFFKTGPGQYGEGDIFLGITVPNQRKVAKKYSGASLDDLHRLLQSKVHEHRLVGLLILIGKYKKADQAGKKLYTGFYLAHIPHINNWDLVDLSAGYILGDFMRDKDKTLLYKLAGSRNLWARRIAVMATFAFIRAGSFEVTLKIAEMLLHDRHDLIHKAVGWMLREIGKKDLAAEEAFVDKYHKEMPRTMLRYAIERFDEPKRRHYLGR
ncbi:MAG: DNA alkylation repair protein [Nitrospirae bacterium]|nr:DNA alkylation repair protein [Nitrospirota bacterium]